MATRTDMEAALAELRGAPFFTQFVKTLEARRTDVIEKMITAPAADVEALRGEVRAYDYILKAYKRETIK